ncbi:MAG: YncE family protein [bacterium]|nr:YncE family protein [bacterium]
MLHPVARISGGFVPKSVVASGTGLYFAQNMMYRHTISVLDHQKNLVATIDDSVDLRAFGYDVPGDVYRGAPVEAAFTSDGSFAFVSNYRMYGPGFNPHAGSDSCQKDQGQDSFVYRIDTTTLDIDRVYPVGRVPKHLAVTSDDRLLLVSNWCGFDTTVIDLATDERVASVDVGRYPRGIAVTSDSDTAYIALMGSTDIAVINLSALLSMEDTPSALDTSVRTYIRGVGVSPRHLVLSPDDETLYVTLSGEDAVVAVDLDSGQVIQRVHTGHAPRSMDISTDGTALYVVNYESDTMSKIRTLDFTIRQEFETTPKPIGITYDPFNDEVWVSTYTGTIHVYAERE